MSGNFLNSFAGSVAGSAATGAIGVLGDIAVGAINRKWQKEQYATEKKDEQARYERQRKDYLEDLENERQYNSASSQIDRLRDAGLNPNLMGSSSLSAGQSSSATPMGNSGPTSESAKISSDLGRGMISSSMNDSIRRLNASKGAEAEAIANLQTELGVTEKKFRPVRQSLIRAQAAEADGKAALAAEQVNVAVKEALRIESVTNAQNIDNETKDEMNRAVINEINSRKSKNDSEALVNGLIAAYKEVENKWQKANYWINVLFKTSFMVANIGGTVKDFLRLFKSKASGLTLPDESKTPLPKAIEQQFPQTILELDESFPLSTLDGL